MHRCLTEGRRNCWIRASAADELGTDRNHQEEHIESSETGAHYDQEIAGDDGLGVIANKRPAVPRDFSHPLRHRRCAFAQIAAVELCEHAAAAVMSCAVVDDEFIGTFEHLREVLRLFTTGVNDTGDGQSRPPRLIRTSIHLSRASTRIDHKGALLHHVNALQCDLFSGILRGNVTTL